MFVRYVNLKKLFVFDPQVAKSFHTPVDQKLISLRNFGSSLLSLR